MAQKQKSGKITIANWIAVVGIVLLMVFSFMGFSFMSGGELGESLLKTLGVTAISALLLWFLIKAKGAENNLKKWLIAEYLVLFIYIAFAIGTSLKGGIMYYFVINDKKEEIKEYARKDFEKMDNLFAAYEEFENAAITNTRQGLMNATQPRQRLTDTLATYITNNRLTALNVETNLENQQTLILGEEFNSLKEYYYAEKDRILNCVESWNAFLIPFEANKIVELAKMTGETLTGFSQNPSLKLPVIVLDSASNKYTLSNETQSQEFCVEGGIEGLQFQQALTKYEGYSILAIVVTALFHFLILFNYIVAYRTKTISVGKNAEDDGGIIL